MTNACKYSNYKLDIKFPIYFISRFENSQLCTFFATENISSWMGTGPVPKMGEKKGDKYAEAMLQFFSVSLHFCTNILVFNLHCSVVFL